MPRTSRLASAAALAAHRSGGARRTVGALRSQATIAPQQGSATHPDPILLRYEQPVPDSPLRTNAGPQIANRLHHPQPFWQGVERWKGVTNAEFLTYSWQTANTLERKYKLMAFLDENVAAMVPPPSWTSMTEGPPSKAAFISKAAFLSDVEAGMKAASMSVRLNPYILSIIDWTDPFNDPISRQFLPFKSSMVSGGSLAQLDSLHEEEDSPVKNLVHRYPDKVLFLVTNVCPVYCRFCTRSYAVGAPTESVTKSSIRSPKARQEVMFQYIADHPAIQDVVVSGGDSYYLEPDHLLALGKRLFSIPNVKRIRIATKGLCVSPMRIIDPKDDWADALIRLSDYGRTIGKSVALHTHFNREKEITWITELAARKLFGAGVTVRNQSVLLRGINDSVEAMAALIRKLADLNIQPYYVYQGDMVQGLDDLRTPLSTILHLEKHIRGTIAGFMTPSFVVDLPGGGGKRLATSYETYDEKTGVSTWNAPGVVGDKIFEYHDPKF